MITLGRMDGADCYDYFREWHVAALVLVAVKRRDLKVIQDA